MIKNIKIFIIMFFLIFAFCSGCVKNSGDRKIYFSETEVRIKVGETYILFPQLIGINQDEVEIAVDGAGIIDIDGFNVIGLLEGRVTLTLFYSADPSIYGVLTINVEAEPYIRFTQDRITVKLNASCPLPLEYGNLNGFDEISFIFTRDDIINLEQDFITAINIGEVKVTAYYVFDKSIYSEILVIVEEEKIISFTSDVLELSVNDKADLPLVTQGISDISDIEFTIANEQIAMLTGTIITALKPGETTLTATLIGDDKVYAAIALIVTPQPYTIFDPEYWIQNLNPKYNADTVILSPAEIALYNQNVFNGYLSTKVVNLLDFPLTVQGTEIREKINGYDQLMTKYTIYDKGIPISETEKTTIKNNRNIDMIASTVAVRYGIITEFTAVRSFPTLCYANSSKQDRFQETGLNVGEGVIVYHETADGEWFFVQTMNYYGWVEAKKIGLCSREMMVNYLAPDHFIVVIANILMIGGQQVRMGQALPYKLVTDTEYIVTMPLRDAAGKLVLNDCIVTKDETVSDGYLPYTLENVFLQAFKMLGIPYSWGDIIIEGRDCSSTQNAIYTCFGFKMPRNTSNQRAIPQYGQTVNGLSENQLISALRPGTLIFTSGHVMMYIGEDEYGNAYIYHNTSANRSQCIVQSYKTYSGQINAILKLY
ncbi:MAG: SH3 domain-containing protein [Bacilli bacterium]|nr:SH3 domain-containing protein [Bacilli bacterium]MDD4076897.1 SH3 domain-containing protein [Bacilli bacterium]MDD4388597.1 SH3 domain-containing protein [Bacilli bacterium]